MVTLRCPGPCRGGVHLHVPAKWSRVFLGAEGLTVGIRQTYSVDICGLEEHVLTCNDRCSQSPQIENGGLLL